MAVTTAKGQERRIAVGAAGHSVGSTPAIFATRASTWERAGPVKVRRSDLPGSSLGRDVEYVVVEQSGYAEIYAVTGGLPVRVTTSAVETEHSSAAFEVSEHTSDGTRIHDYRLEASVAG